MHDRNLENTEEIRLVGAVSEDVEAILRSEAVATYQQILAVQLALGRGLSIMEPLVMLWIKRNRNEILRVYERGLFDG